MTEEENESVEQAVTQGIESEETQSQAETQEAPRRKDADYNWEQARRKMQELERIASEQQQLINKLTKDSSDDDEDLGSDDLLTVAQAKKLAEKEAKRIAEQMIKQREAATFEERITLKYPDYNQVVTDSNIEYLKTNEPELAMSLHALAHDPYAQAVAAYKLMKKINNPGVDMSKDKKKAESNMQKPMSVNAVSKSSPIGNAHLFENGLTPELKKQLWKEMQDAMKHG